MFLGQAGMFLSFQARRSSAMRSSTSDLTVVTTSCLALKSVESIQRNKREKRKVVAQMTVGPGGGGGGGGIAPLQE